MSNLITKVLLLTLISIAATNPVERITLIKNELFEVTLASEVIREQFSSAHYDEETENLHFITYDNIRSILIFKGDEMEMVLPVMSDRIIIGKSLFSEGGSYNLAFSFEASEELTYAEMVMR